MNYKFELHTKESGSKSVFKTSMWEVFKVNIIEKYVGKMNFNPKLSEALFKVRTLDNELITAKNGNGRIKIKYQDFEIYQNLTNLFYSYEYKNKLINKKEIEQDYVYFILRLVIFNYELNYL